MPHIQTGCRCPRNKAVQERVCHLIQATQSVAFAVYLNYTPMKIPKLTLYCVMLDLTGLLLEQKRLPSHAREGWKWRELGSKREFMCCRRLLHWEGDHLIHQNSWWKRVILRSWLNLSFWSLTSQNTHMKFCVSSSDLTSLKLVHTFGVDYKYKL